MRAITVATIRDVAAVVTTVAAITAAIMAATRSSTLVTSISATMSVLVIAMKSGIALALTTIGEMAATTIFIIARKIASVMRPLVLRGRRWTRLKSHHRVRIMCTPTRVEMSPATITEIGNHAIRAAGNATTYNRLTARGRVIPIPAGQVIPRDLHRAPTIAAAWTARINPGSTAHRELQRGRLAAPDDARLGRIPDRRRPGAFLNRCRNVLE